MRDALAEKKQTPLSIDDVATIFAVRGYIVSGTPGEIVVNIDIETGGYLFE